MKYIKNFENNKNIKYEFYIHKANEDKILVINRDFYKYNNYDLDSMIDVYIKVKGDEKGISIKKVILEDVDIDNNQKYQEYLKNKQLKKDIKKYNL